MAPTQDLCLKKNLVNPFITEKIMQKFITGESIPMIDRKTFLNSNPRPISNEIKTPKGTMTPRIPKTDKASHEPIDSKPLPEPRFTVNESYTLTDMPFKPMHYVRYIEPTKEDMDSRVDYDMDEEDMAWLDIENGMRNVNGAPIVSMDDFEMIMDRFEKECYFEIKRKNTDLDTLDIQDEEAICCICMDGESQSFNEILFCEMCNLAVHQECYGIPYIPEGQWLCRRCLNSPSAAVDCILCPSNTGALKMVEGGYWSHILCAIWVPEVQFANPVFLEPVESVARIPSSRWKLTCELCKLKGVGACIQCTQKKCNVAFHPTCAQQAGYYMKFEGRPSEPKTKFNRTVYCTRHRPKIEDSTTDKFEYFRQKMLKSVKTPILFQPIVPPENIQSIGDRVDFQNKNNFVTKLLAYWSLKRHERKGVPLLRTTLYELKKTENLSSHGHGNIMSEVEYKRCLRFRQEMEKVRLLLELVRKREKLKLEYIKVKELCMKAKLAPIAYYLENVVEILCSLDEEKIFENPVSLDEVPNYKQIIENPMDFATIKSKTNNFEYNGIEDLERDFNLMIDNCLRYNKNNVYYYQAGLNLRNKARKVFKKSKEDLKVSLNDQNIMPSARGDYYSDQNLLPSGSSDNTNDQILCKIKIESKINGYPEMSSNTAECNIPSSRSESLRKRQPENSRRTSNRQKILKAKKSEDTAAIAIKMEALESTSQENEEVISYKKLRESNPVGFNENTTTF